MPSPRLGEAVAVTGVQQFASLVLFELNSQAAMLMPLWLAAFCGFWAGTGIIAVRRRGAPTRADIAFVKWSFVPLLLLAGPLAWLASGAAGPGH